jgi:hypothetical protein
MVTVHISEQLAARLTKRAAEERRSLDEVVEHSLEQTTSHHGVGNDQYDLKSLPGTLAALVEVANNTYFHSGQSDVADHSREILNTEYLEYLEQKYGLEKKSKSGD